MADKEEKQPETKEATQAGAEEGREAETKEASKEKTYTQAELDQRITEAGIKSEKRMIEAMELKEAQADQKRLEEAGKYEELYRSKNAETEALKAKNKVAQFNMDARKLVSDLGLANHDSLIGNTDSLQTVVQRAEQYKADVAKDVEAGILEALNTGKDHVPKTNTNTTDKTVDQLTPEEFKEWKTAQGLY